MDRNSSHFVAFSLAFILFAACSLFAQPPGHVEVPQLRTFPARGFGCSIPSGHYDEEKLRLILERANCPEELTGLNVDFQKETLIRYSVGSDCHMRVVVRVYRVDAEKRYKAIINNIYGGCRAGGWRMGWIVIEKLPPGYNMDVVEVKIDRIHGDFGDGFLFPKPPPIIERKPLETREIDMKGCLPLTGQSQWVISSARHLTDAIRDQANELACTGHFKDLDIDFQKQTLVGYSFSSGHCGRPPGLVFETVKQISSDRYENRFVLTASFDAPGKDYCSVWTTYPVWVIVPALPPGYGFAFEARARTSKTPEKLESRVVDLKDCIHLYGEMRRVLTDRQSYVKAVRNDASRDDCLRDVEAVDFEKYSLIGIELNTGYCRTPIGLEHQVTRDDQKKSYVLSIDWIVPPGSRCRALSQHDLWVLVPRLPDGYAVIFETRPK